MATFFWLVHLKLQLRLQSGVCKSTCKAQRRPLSAPRVGARKTTSGDGERRRATASAGARCASAAGRVARAFVRCFAISADLKFLSRAAAARSLARSHARTQLLSTRRRRPPSAWPIDEKRAGAIGRSGKRRDRVTRVVGAAPAAFHRCRGYLKVETIAGERVIAVWSGAEARRLTGF